LATEVKNSAKVTLLSFNRTAVFLCDVMVLENAVLEARWCSWWICVGNSEFRLQVSTTSRVNQSQMIGNVGFVEVSLLKRYT